MKKQFEPAGEKTKTPKRGRVSKKQLANEAAEYGTKFKNTGRALKKQPF